jgi:hypothetical protein
VTEASSKDHGFKKPLPGGIVERGPPKDPTVALQRDEGALQVFSE